MTATTHLSRRDDITTEDVEVSRTVILPLETSVRKNRILSAILGPVRETMARTADVLPSYPPREWGGRSTSLYRQVVKNRPDSEREVPLPSGDVKKVKTPVLQAAMETVSSNYKSYLSNGREGDRPSRDEYLDATYVPAKDGQIELVANDRGYGLKASLLSYADDLWWHIKSTPYHEQYLERVVADDTEATAGQTEFHLTESGGVRAHMAVSWEVPTYEKADAETAVGVYFTPRTLYAVTAVDLADAGSDKNKSGETHDTIDDVRRVEIESSDQFRYHRSTIRQKRERLMEKGDLAGVKAARNHWRNYTKQMLDTASKRVVDVASDVAPCEIRLPDFDGFRESVDEHHDWPYREFADKVTYKAANAGIPVSRVPTYDVARVCRQCGHAIAESELHFECPSCGYEVRREINAAFNVARGGVQSE